jgi:uncharacterized protein YgbK (DUF1537 family)
MKRMNKKRLNYMIKLLIISDDFTGALDTSVQLATNGATTYVMVGSRLDVTKINSDVEVLAIDAETRHLKPKEAYQIVYSIVKEAQKIRIPYLYKKTDSALRGNIGSELTAALDASGAKHIHFIPAFPRIGRTTADGIQYVNGVPIAESVFGSDHFEPVCYSSVSEIIASQSSIETHVIGRERGEGHVSGKGILIHDACSNQDFENIAAQLMEINDLSLIAGCAGFASILPRILHLNGERPRTPELNPRMFIVCGSINPISVVQCEYAERKGARRFRLTPRQKLSTEWARSDASESLVQEICNSCQEHPVVILDTNGPGDPEKTDAYACEHGISPERIRTDVVAVMGQLMERLIHSGLDSTILIMGGDLLFQFIRQTGIKAVTPVCELECGVVLSQIIYEGKKRNIISKSGGFGDQTLFMELSESLERLSGGK